MTRGKAGSCIEEFSDGTRIQVRAIPRGHRSQVVSIEEEEVVIRLAAPPVDGKANQALIDFLSQTLAIRKSAISMLSGEKSRHKALLVSGLGPNQVREKLQREVVRA